MMIVMKEGASDGQIQSIVDRVTAAGAQAHVSRGEFVTVIGAIGDDRELVASLALEGEDGVERVVLVKVVNPQSFHWSMDLHLPLARLAALVGLAFAAAVGASLAAGRLALGQDAIRAVRDDA